MKSIPLLLLIVSLASCSALAEQKRVYFGMSQSKGIYFADLDIESGTLSKPKLAATISNPGFISIHPNGHFLFSTTDGFEKPNTGGVAAFNIQAEGTLSLINKQPSEGSGACHLSIDATGRSLLVANYSSGSVAALRILDDGALAPSTSIHQHAGSGTNPKRQQAPHPHSVCVNPANTFAYIPDLGIDKLMIYKLDPATAQLTEAGFAKVPGDGQGPRHMKFSSDGRHAYVINEMALSVATFAQGTKPGELVYQSSTLTVPDLAETVGMSCAEIRIHPNGRFVYASTRDGTNEGRDSISVFQITAEHGLSLIEVVPAEVAVPRNFNLDPSGKWMLVGGQKSNDIALFAVNQESGQIQFTGTRVPFEGGPICIEFLQQSNRDERSATAVME
jgi:6-phosphogluconolactonase